MSLVVPPSLEVGRRATPDEWVEWLLMAGFVPRQRLTLTFDQKRQAVSEAGALWYWRRLVQYLNEIAGGHDYCDKWGHSWFSYVAGVEYHKSGAVHLEVATDANWFPYRDIRRWWENWGRTETASIL